MHTSRGTAVDRTRWALAAGIAVVCVVATGCTATVAGHARPSSASSVPAGEVFEQVAPPEVGVCLDTVRGGSGPLGPPETLACTDPHGGEIAKVVDVTGSLDGSFPTEAEVDSDAWSHLLYGDEGCGEFLLVNQYIGARANDNLLVDVAAYLPKRSAREAGAGWVACVVEYRTGILQEANAPGLMAQAIQGPDAAAYRQCWFGPQIVFDRVPCSRPHEAEPTGDSATADAGAPYPSDPLARQPLVEECTTAVIDYLERDIPNGYAAGVYLPSEADWALFPEAACVILDSGGRRTTGSAVDA